MAKKILNIVECAYRATLEEQDDTVLWLLAAMKGAGSDHTVVLKGHAVNYAVKGEDASGLAIAAWKQTQPPSIAQDVADLIAKRSVPVYVVEEDVAERGIERHELVAGVKPIGRAGVTRLFGEFERALALDQARLSGAILAYAMNGDPLPPEHGFPSVSSSRVGTRWRR